MGLFIFGEYQHRNVTSFCCILQHARNICRLCVCTHDNPHEVRKKTPHLQVHGAVRVITAQCYVCAALSMCWWCLWTCMPMMKANHQNCLSSSYENTFMHYQLRHAERVIHYTDVCIDFTPSWLSRPKPHSNVNNGECLILLGHRRNDLSAAPIKRWKVLNFWLTCTVIEAWINTIYFEINWRQVK